MLRIFHPQVFRGYFKQDFRGPDPDPDPEANKNTFGSRCLAVVFDEG